MSDQTSRHSYEFLKGYLSTSDLLSVVGGDVTTFITNMVDNHYIITNEHGDITISVEEITNLIEQILGESNAALRVEFIFKRVKDKPTTPEGSNPTGSTYGDWRYYPEEDAVDGQGEPAGDNIWVSTGKFQDDELQGTWSEPIRLNGETGYTEVKLYTGSSTVPTSPTSEDPTQDDPQVWYLTPGDVPDANLTSTIIWEVRGYMKDDELLAGWSVPFLYRKIEFERTTYIFARDETQPATPTLEDPSGMGYGDWQYAPYAGIADDDRLWMSMAIFDTQDDFVQSWSTPVMLDKTTSPYYVKQLYKASNSELTVAPTGDNPAGWSINPQAARVNLGDPEADIYVSVALVLQNTQTVIGSWSIPTLWSGIRGLDGVDGVDGEDGGDGYSVFLTNENHTFHTESEQVIAEDWSGGNTKVVVYKGNTKFTCTNSTVGATPTVTETYTVKSITAVSGSLLDIDYTTSLDTEDFQLNIQHLDTRAITLKLEIEVIHNEVVTTYNRLVSYSLVTDGSVHFRISPETIVVPPTGFEGANDGVLIVSGLFGGINGDTAIPYDDALTPAKGTWKVQNVAIVPGGSLPHTVSTSGNQYTITPTDDPNFGSGHTITVQITVRYTDYSETTHDYIVRTVYITFDAAAAGDPGIQGNSVKLVWRRSQTLPTTPGPVVNPPDWESNPYDEDNITKRLWMSMNYIHNNDVVAPWTTPVTMDVTLDEQAVLDVVQNAFNQLLAQIVQDIEDLQTLTTDHNTAITQIIARLDVCCPQPPAE